MTGCALVAAGYTLEAPITVCALAAAAALAERISVRFAVAQRGLTRTEEQSIALLPMLFAAVLFGPLAAAAIGAVSMLGDPELTSEQVAFLQATITASGALERVERMIDEYAREADRALSGARLDNAAVGDLRDLARAATVRSA